MRLAPLAFVPVLCLAACSDGGGALAPPDDREPEPEPVAYPDGEAGLSQLMGDLTSALERGDRAAAGRLAASLELPGHEAWFAEAFGPERGARLADEYAPALGQFEQLAEVIGAAVRSGKAEISVERFESADDPAATGYQSIALGAMKKPVALYSVRMLGEDDAFHLWSLVHAGGTFRWVGKLAAAADKPHTGKGIDKRAFRRRDADAVAEKLAPAAGDKKPRRGGGR